VGIAVLAVRLFLAAVLAVAGAAKLADLRGSREAVIGFGIPRRFSRIAGTALPVAELAVAAALLPAKSSLWALAGAAGLLIAFTGAIGLSMARGRAPDCHCFGQLHSEPAGPRTLIRNTVLLTLALAAFGASIGDTGPSAVAWVGDLAAVQILLVAAGTLALGTAAGIVIARAQAKARELKPGLADADEMGLPEGWEAPEFALPDLDGSIVTLSELLLRGSPVLLVFTDAECAACQALLTKTGEWQQEHEDALTIAVVNGGAPDGTRELALEHGVQDVLFDSAREMQKAYEVAKTPVAVRIDPPGVISSPFTSGQHGAGWLIEATVTGREPLVGDPPGTALPHDVVLEGADGQPVRLTDFVGEETLFMFWSPDCGSCREIREELLVRERNPQPGTPRLVLITWASRREIRAEGFKSPILFDRDRVSMEALSVRGTPAGVLADAEGRTAWPLALGKRHLLRLIRSRATVSA
jgi:peroxiredoxin